LKRMRRRTAVVLALAAAGAVATGSFALANTASNGNVSGAKFDFQPHKVPKTKFHKGALTLGTSTVFADPGNKPNGGSTNRVQLWIDDDIKLNVNSVPKCNPSSMSSNTTMRQAMQACGSSKVGSGIAHTAAADPSGVFPLCVLVFNATNNRVILFSRLFASTPLNCANPSTNNGGDTSVILFGKLKGASGDFGTQLNVDTSQTALPLGDFKAKIKRGKYAVARCHDGNHQWNVKSKHTYSDGVTSVDHVKKTCHVA
jgi:hypothetical protein